MGGVVEMEWYLKFEFVRPIFYCRKLANAYSIIVITRYLSYGGLHFIYLFNECAAIANNLNDLL